MQFLYSHLRPGSFVNAYADTDSMCLGLSRTKPIPEDATLEEYYRCLFDPLVRPDMLNSWESTWKQWFCTTKAVEDQRKPGKLKSKFIFIFFNNNVFQRNSASQRATSLHWAPNATSLGTKRPKPPKEVPKVCHTPVHWNYNTTRTSCTAIKNISQQYDHSEWSITRCQEHHQNVHHSRISSVNSVFRMTKSPANHLL